MAGIVSREHATIGGIRHHHEETWTARKRGVSRAFPSWVRPASRNFEVLRSPDLERPSKRGYDSQIMARYLHLHVALRHTNVWRRVRIRQTYLLTDLHDAIQSAFDWHDCHLYQFVAADGRRALCPHGEDFGADFGEAPSGRAAKTKLSQILKKKGDACLYEYDFGDSWELDIVVERVASETKDDPWLLDGALAGPPEDCGGVPGYERCAQFVRTGVDSYDEGDSLGEWLGAWNPDAFVSPAKKRGSKKPRTKKTAAKRSASSLPNETAPTNTTLDQRKLEEGGLAILAFTLHGGNRAWKNFDRTMMAALFERGWISNPATKAKSVALSEEGIRRAEEFALKYFGA